jgi:hypothetical protein
MTKKQCCAAFEREHDRAALAQREAVLADDQLRIHTFCETMDAIDCIPERRACLDIARALSAELEDEQDAVTALAQAAELDRPKADTGTISNSRYAPTPYCPQGWQPAKVIRGEVEGRRDARKKRTS